MRQTYWVRMRRALENTVRANDGRAWFARDPRGALAFTLDTLDIRDMAVQEGARHAAEEIQKIIDDIVVGFFCRTQDAHDSATDRGEALTATCIDFAVRQLAYKLGQFGHG